MEKLLTEVRECSLCEAQLPYGPRPVLQASKNARILIAGQAPGRKVHETGIPFNDPSGNRLREWMGISSETFYDPNIIAILPMGFCYPGTGKSGDLPPRPECAKTWREPLINALSNLKLTLIIGTYAQNWHLRDKQKDTLTETVKAWPKYLQDHQLPLPHPSPRNNRWLKQNPWFEAELVPLMREKISQIIAQEHT